MIVLAAVKMRTGLYCVWVLCCVVIHHPGPAVAQGGGGMATTATTDMATQTEPGESASNTTNISSWLLG